MLFKCWSWRYWCFHILLVAFDVCMYVVSTINLLLSLLCWISCLGIWILVATLGDHGNSGGPGGDLAGYSGYLMQMGYRFFKFWVHLSCVVGLGLKSHLFKASYFRVDLFCIF
ncbi:hypothetical protein Sjap_019722 [Stephania japonica]|uniref:Uncharacterized protein n=1 Tax=Stephania japonica TaxID=461633 RepID=A0AAP0F4L4_9MAGN